MRNNMKYVIVVGDMGTEIPILFDPIMNHSTFEGKFIILSAGFVSLDINRDDEISVTTYGESTTIKNKPVREIDAWLIQRNLR